MSALRPRTSPSLVVAMVALASAIFVADCFIPLGIAVWVLYFLPIALSKFAWRPSIPIWTAAACSVLLIVGYLLSPAGTSAAAGYASLNRTFGLVTLWAAALIGRKFIVSRLAVRREDWFKAGQTGLSARLQGEQTHEQLAQNVLGFLAEYLHAQVGAIYLADGKASYRLYAGYARDVKPSSANVVHPGEGLVGQAARDQQLVHLRDVPEQYMDVRSGLGAHRPREIIIAPASADGIVHALVELGFFRSIEDMEVELFSRVSESLASAVRSATYRAQQRELLAETRRQAEALQTQEEELRVQNEELEEQTRALQHSQAQLENQQTELEQINAQLEEQAHSLASQRDNLTRAQGDLQRSNQYKSEFLANMSHELRTPLNSSLILSRLLLENREGNLTPEQVKFATTIYSAGNDLLTLINDILDLSKIEAGKLEIRPELITVARVLDELRGTFQHVARDKGLELSLNIDAITPATMFTDPTRLQQIIKNLVSNALKFTAFGGVSLRVTSAQGGTIAFAVTDTGIGIPVEQHEVIFEAFRQADGTTNRKYGGTGLGLSISRDLARLLGGELTVESEPGRGSTFTLLLPQRHVFQEPREAAREPIERRVKDEPPTRAKEEKQVVLVDDRERMVPGARAILVIEDDPAFAQVLHDLAHELDFQVLLAHTAESGLAMAERYRPSAIVLDVGLPDRSGLSVLDALKHKPATRHIPVHVVSGSDYTRSALEMGAAGYAIKPVKREDLAAALRKLEDKFTQKLRRVLIVEDNEVHRESTRRLVGGEGVECIAVATAAEALRELGRSTFDCMILDLTLPDRSGLELLEEMAQKDQYAFPPVIVYTGRSLSGAEEQELRRFSSAIIIKGARSPERLLDEVTLFLHQVETDLPLDRQRMLRDARHRESVFEGRRVLVVEDDVRNIFALTSVLEPKGARVEIARNGKEALAHLEQKPGVDLVLMDIMMPEMDGITATREIRKQPQYAKLPIIALTAKAMVDDREKCLEAGVSDYIAKPLDVDKLLSLARVWMPK